jgi:hypothetical protein
MMTLRMIGLDDYTVHEDRRLVGRIRKKSAPTSTGVEAEAEAPDRSRLSHGGGIQTCAPEQR